MHLVVNGEKKDVPLDDATVAGLLASLGLPRERVAVEVNGGLVKRAEHAASRLKDGDKVEIVTLVGGG